MAMSEVDLIMQRARKLSADETLRLIQKRAADLLVRNQPKAEETKKEQTTESEPRQGIYFGKYANTGRRMSTEEDFKLAEYHFDENEWK